MITAYAVTWRRKPIAMPFILDVDSMELAAEISIRLTGVPLVYDVKVTGLEEAEMDAETKARIKARIVERQQYEWAVGM